MLFYKQLTLIITKLFHSYINSYLTNHYDGDGNDDIIIITINIIMLRNFIIHPHITTTLLVD